MMILEGPWQTNHLTEHKVMFDNLVSLLADIDHAYTEEGTPIVLPRNENGVVLWNEVSVAFIIQWYMMNAQRLKHNHKEEKDGITPSGTN
jgi:hypothetical protein